MTTTLLEQTAEEVLELTEEQAVERTAALYARSLAAGGPVVMDGRCLVVSNGSAPDGTRPAPLAALAEMLRTEPLDRIFEEYGNFAYQSENGLWQLGGNFHSVSHAFTVIAPTLADVAELVALIRENQRRPDYLAQPDAAARAARREAVWAESRRRVRGGSF